MKREETVDGPRAQGFIDHPYDGERAAWRRTTERRPAASAVAVRLPMSFTEADKFRWIVANRSSFDLLDALRLAASDAEFDALIESAMRVSVTGPSYFAKRSGL